MLKGLVDLDVLCNRV